MNWSLLFLIQLNEVLHVWNNHIADEVDTTITVVFLCCYLINADFSNFSFTLELQIQGTWYRVNDYIAMMLKKNIRKAAKIHARALVAAFEVSLFYVLSGQKSFFGDYWRI